MDEEKMQRRMEFLLEWQAQFASKLGQLEDDLTRVNKGVEQQGENIQRLGENVERLVGIVERVVDTVARLAQVNAERFEAVDRRDDETNRKIAALVDSQIQTEESLRNLSATLDRHIAEGHDGRKDKEEG